MYARMIYRRDLVRCCKNRLLELLNINLSAAWVVFSFLWVEKKDSLFILGRWLQYHTTINDKLYPYHIIRFYTKSWKPKGIQRMQAAEMRIKEPFSWEKLQIYAINYYRSAHCSCTSLLIDNLMTKRYYSS